LPQKVKLKLLTWMVEPQWKPYLTFRCLLPGSQLSALMSKLRSTLNTWCSTMAPPIPHKGTNSRTPSGPRIYKCNMNFFTYSLYANLS
jgi:hypothetical protein